MPTDGRVVGKYTSFFAHKKNTELLKRMDVYFGRIATKALLINFSINKTLQEIENRVKNGDDSVKLELIKEFEEFEKTVKRTYKKKKEVK